MIRVYARGSDVTVEMKYGRGRGLTSLVVEEDMTVTEARAFFTEGLELCDQIDKDNEGGPEGME